MRQMRTVLAISTLLTLCLATAAQAGHHQWIITEVFSNDDGTIQFVELIGTADGEQGVTGFTIDTSPAGTSGAVMTTASLAGPVLGPGTNGQYFLVGTAGYATAAAAQSAPAPDATLPDNFLELDVDTVRYAGISATDVGYTAGQLPTDGIDSIDLENVLGTVNTPQNSSGATGSIDVSAPPPPSSVPTLPRIGVILLVGFVVATATLALRRRRAGPAL